MQISWESNTDLIIHQFLLLSSFSLPTFPFKITKFHPFYHLASIHSLLTHLSILHASFSSWSAPSLLPPPSRSSFPPIPPLPSLLFHSFSIYHFFWPPLSLSFLSPPTPPPSYLSLPFIPFLLLSHSLLFRLFPF